MNPDTVHKDKDVGARIVNIAKEVNCHHCTKPCEKYENKCRYGFPRFPLKVTLVVDKHEFDDIPTEYKKQAQICAEGCEGVYE